MDCALAPAAADMVELLEQGDLFFGIVKKVELDIAVDEAAELDTDEADELAAFIDVFEELKSLGDEGTGLGCIRDAALLREGIEVGIADLDGDTTCQLRILAELEGELVDHSAEHAADHFHIEGIFAQGAFLGHGFLLAVGDHLATVDGVGALPEVAAHFSKFTVEQWMGNVAEHPDGPDAHEAEFFVGLLPDTGNLAGRERGKEFTLLPGEDLLHAVGLGLAGADLGNKFVD